MRLRWQHPIKAHLSRHGVNTCLTVKLTEGMWNLVLQVQERPAAMAGKGRGVAAFTFNIEALGIGRGSMPETRVGPSPLFPVSTNHTLAYAMSPR